MKSKLTCHACEKPGTFSSGCNAILCGTCGIWIAPCLVEGCIECFGACTRPVRIMPEASSEELPKPPPIRVKYDSYDADD